MRKKAKSKRAGTIKVRAVDFFMFNVANMNRSK